MLGPNHVVRQEVSMSYHVSVRLGSLICRNRESTTAPHDIFGLAGAVIVDGEAQGFAFEGIPINERQPWSYAAEVFNGVSESPTIELKLLGLDIDDNEKWVRNREEIGELADKISEFAGHIPVIGDFAAFVIEIIPDVVDQFVEWDENDVLLDHASTIDLSADAVVPFRASSRRMEVKFSGSDRVGYSDWDYSLHIGVTNTYTPAAPFGGGPVEKTLKPFVDTRPSDWIGDWESEHVRCAIRVSEYSLGLLDVHVTELMDGRSTDSETLRVGISRVFLQAATAFDPAVVASGGIEDDTVDFVPSLVVERASGRTAVVTDVLTGLGGVTVAGTAATTGQFQVAVEPPPRRQSGSDLLELSNDAVLEIYHVLHDGEIVGDVKLRYIRPVVNVVWRLGGEIDELLSPRVF
jgi:hypothetical protein